jgi:hypothetical protein
MRKDKLINRFLSVITIAVSLSALSCAAHKVGSSTDSTTRCTKTSDCTGDSVCVSGKCVGSNENSSGSGNGSGGNGSGSGTSGGSAGSGAINTTATSGAGGATASMTTSINGVCAEGASTTRMAPQIILLLDGSSSMNEDYGNSTRWAAMRDAIVNPNNGVVKTMQEQIAFALVIFAGQYLNGGGSCPIPGQVIPHNLNNYDAIAAALPQESPGEHTPTGEALDAVCKALPGVSENGSLPQYVILATDGEPNSCTGGGTGGGGRGTGGGTTTAYQSVIDAANRCRDAGVTIYVISLAPDATSEFQANLQQVADIGGTSTVYSPQDPDQLSSDLGKLVGGTLNCDVRLNGNVVQGKECENSEVKLGTEDLTCNDANGWILVEPTVIRLQGTACEAFKNDPGLQVTAKFPCEVFTPGSGGSGGNGAGGAGGSGTGTDSSTIII